MDEKSLKINMSDRELVRSDDAAILKIPVVANPNYQNRRDFKPRDFSGSNNNRNFDRYNNRDFNQNRDQNRERMFRDQRNFPRHDNRDNRNNNYQNTYKPRYDKRKEPSDTIMNDVWEWSAGSVINFVKKMSENLNKLLIKPSISFLSYLRWVHKKKDMYLHTKAMDVSGATTLYSDLSSLQLETLPVPVLRSVSQLVKNRGVSVSKKEYSNLPVWIKGASKPNNIKETNLIGFIVPTVNGKWYLMINPKNFDKLINSEETFPHLGGITYKEYFSRFLPTGKLEDYEGPIGKTFVKIPKSKQQDYIVSFLRSFISVRHFDNIKNTRLVDMIEANVKLEAKPKKTAAKPKFKSNSLKINDYR